VSRGRRSALAVLVAAVAVTFGTPSTSGAARAPKDAWPQLGHDNGSSFHNGRASLTVREARRLRPAWTYTPPGTVNGAAAVVGHRLYALSGDGLVALDADRGDELWTRDDISGTSSPTFARGNLYVNGSDSELWALDPKTGEDRWNVVTDDQEFAVGFSSPVVAGKVVVVGLASIEEVAAEANATFRGGAVAFDRGTGKERWRYRTADPPYNGVGVWSTPSFDAATHTVYLTTGNNYTESAGPTSDSIVALDVATGEPKWMRQVTTGDVFTVPNPFSEDSDLGTNPILFDATIDGVERRLLGAGQKSGMFWVLDRATGEVVWQRQVSGGSSLIGGVLNNGAFDGRSIIVAGNNGPSSTPRPDGAPAAVLMALDPATGAVQWQRDLDAWVWAPITLGNGVGFVAPDDEVQAFDTKTGRELFHFATDGTVSSAPVIVDKRVYFGSGISYLSTKPGKALYALEP
jgi:polyvinyl alcohol dehydrogenase (cytochrome)